MNDRDDVGSVVALALIESSAIEHRAPMLLVITGQKRHYDVESREARILETGDLRYPAKPPHFQDDQPLQVTVRH